MDRSSDNTDSHASALQRLAALQRLREQATSAESEDLLRTIDHLIELDTKAARATKPTSDTPGSDDKPQG